jgi:CO/xanthine dehydrogenase FAD-binding subunit
VKSPPFEYARTGSLDEACELLHQHGDAAKVLAGGQSLVPMMAFRLLRPSWMIDINEIPALKYVKVEGDVARIGATTRQCVIAADDALAAKLPLVRQALVCT